MVKGIEERWDREEGTEDWEGGTGGGGAVVEGEGL